MPETYLTLFLKLTELNLGGETCGEIKKLSSSLNGSDMPSASVTHMPL